ncbi:hypothetical protein JTB14_032808 [Gonioctena quinquepunctata]|nr:hypothetical protein JTB14_032808 [Gonioctena quinquepunctata]
MLTDPLPVVPIGVEDNLVKDNYMQSTNVFDPECNRKLHIGNKNHGKKLPLNAELTKKRIAIISDQKGRGMASYLMSLAKDEFIIESTVKPGASDRELADTVFNNTKNYNENDFVIVWPKINNKRTTTELMTRLLKPQLIIITDPFRYDKNSNNDFAYNNNLTLKKQMFQTKKHNNVFECNATLKRWHYRRDGYTLRAPEMAYFQGVELQDAEQNVKTNPSQTGNFLYPRLSQVAPDL